MEFNEVNRENYVEERKKIMITFLEQKGIPFLQEKNAITVPGREYLLQYNLPGLLKQSNEYFVNAANRLFSLMNSQDAIRSQDAMRSTIPNDIHIFTKEEFIGYDLQNIFFLKYACQIQRYQESGLCYLHAPTIVQTYNIINSTKDATKTSVLDIAKYIMTYFTAEQLHKHIFDNKGGSSELFLENILTKGSNTIASLSAKSVIKNFESYGPGLVSSFKVYNDFLDEKMKHHCGEPKGEYKGLHSMVMVGWKKEGEKIFILLQNWWKEKQFVEVDSEYFNKCGPITYFITTPQDKIPDKFNSLDGIFHELFRVDCVEELEECYN